MDSAERNSTSPPSESPASCPSRQPWARDSTPASATARPRTPWTRRKGGGGARRGREHLLPLPPAEFPHDGGGAAEAPAGGAAAVRRVGHLRPMLVEQHAARGQQQGVAAAVVPAAGTVERHRRDAVASGHPGQPVGDARQSDVAGRVDAGGVGTGFLSASCEVNTTEGGLAFPSSTASARLTVTAWPLRVSGQPSAQAIRSPASSG